MSFQHPKSTLAKFSFSLEDFRRSLLTWFQTHARRLPWRQTRDPYAVWVSEIMLQQTRVETVLAYYERFLRRFPNVETLAAAEPEEVLRHWQGLGYYRRAQNLHAAAQHIVREYAGRWPDTVKAWERLPGVGQYVARAVASIALGVPVGVVDGNVRRVLARLLALEHPRSRDLQHQADTLVDPTDPGAFNQAMMELGATVCTPTRPACPVCPVRTFCQGYRTGHPERFPTPIPTRRRPEEAWWVFLVWHSGRWLMVQRPDGLLRGMWLFPMHPRTADLDIPSVVKDVRVLPPIMHEFTHRRWCMTPVWVHWPDHRDPSEAAWFAENGRWIPSSELDRIPIPRAHRKVLQAVLRELGNWGNGI